MSNLSTLPKGDSAWLLRKAIERIIQQVSVLETNIGASTSGNSANTQIIFNDNGTLRGDAGLVYNKTTDALTVAGLVTAGSATITGAATVGTTLGVTGVSTFAAGTALLPALTTTGDTNTGIYYPAADTFAVTTGGTERYRVDSSGNVGIGVTPSAWRNTQRALQFGAVGTLFSNVASNGSTCIGRNVYESTAGDFTYIVNDEATFYEQTATGTHAWYTAVAGTGTIAFGDAKMTLDASGNLLVGKTASSTSVAGAQVQPDGTHSAVKSDANPGFFYNTTTAISGTIALFRSNGVTVGSISQDGTNTAYNLSSDYRLKEQVQPLVGGLARVNSLKPSIYKWKTNGSNGEGFLAHELAVVVPFAVTGPKDAMNEDGTINPQGVDLSKIVPILVAAIQELTAEVNALKNA